MSIEQLPKEELQEMSMLEIAYELLLEKNQPMHLNDLVDEIAKLLGSTKDEVAANIAQFYTDLNVDGRFLNIGGNTWGYKGWYPVEQFEDDVVPTVRVKKKKAKVAELEEDFDEIEDEDLEYEDLDEFVDDFDGDEEEEEEELEEDLEGLEEFDEDLVDDEEEEELLIDEEFEEDELDIEEDDEYIDEENEDDR